MIDALFERRGDAFIPTDLTRGGWSDDSQHGGPPSGLMARMIEAIPTAGPMQVVRLTIDLFRPVPLTPLRVETAIRRNGRRLQVVDAMLMADGVMVGRASALKIRLGEIALPEQEEEGWQPPPGPGFAAPVDGRAGFGHPDERRRFHCDAVEIRTFDGSFGAHRVGTSWFRLKTRVIRNEPTSPFVTLATLADMSNGNAQMLDPRDWLYVNPDITLYSHRHPHGEWIGMRSYSHQHNTGIGLADTRVFDEDGVLGRINQAQIVEPHLP
jgi:hypothetical protein